MFRLGLFEPGQREDVIDQRGESRRMVLDDILKFGAVIVVKSRRIVGKHFRRSENAGYRGPDLVRDI